MPKIVDPTEQRRDIRRAAQRVFARRGVARTGLAHVARAAGMGRSSLYHYYPDKASLVRDLAREILAEEAALFAEAARGPGSPLERIERLARDLTGLFGAWSTVGRLVSDLRVLTAERFRAFFRRIRGNLASVIAEGQRAGEIDGGLDPGLTAATIIGAVDGLLIQEFLDPGVLGRPRALGDALVGTVRKVLRP